MSIEDQVKAILARMLDIDDALIVPAARLREDLGATSIDFVEFMTALENDFDVNIPDDAAGSLTTVQSAADYIRTRTP